MFEIFIKRPILSLVISIFFVLLGVLAITGLPVTQFPDIIPPSVIVTARYTGANAEVCAKTVATPIERAINGVPGMTYMSTVCSNNGVTIVQVNFKVGTDPDLASVNVQNRISTVLDELPEEVIKAGVTTEKEVNTLLLYLNIMSDDSLMDEKFVYNFADINIIPELKRIEGVGFAEILGSREYSMRVWLNPERMTAYNISPDDVIKAIRDQNIEAAPGKSGESSDKSRQILQYVLKYTGKYTRPEEYREIILKANPDGSSLKLKDVAEIEFGALDYSMVSKTDGKYSASILLKQRPGSNAKEVIEKVKQRMEQIKVSSFPPKMRYNITYDVSRFLDASIEEVLKTLIEAFILVFIVVFIFLQDFRSTLIPAIAVPVSLIGTFAFMQLFGFSINLLTLFALVLAIGIVVDNAIVVVEAVHAKMSEFSMGPAEATYMAMKEITGAIIAITLVMSAVFIPVSFLSGPVGVFYRQFSLTLAIAIVISGINALTLSPALCAILLRNYHSHSGGFFEKFFNHFNRIYNNLTGRYTDLISKIAGRRTITWLLLLFFFLSTWGLTRILPTGFIPVEDQGMIYVSVNSPNGATVERTSEILDQIDLLARADSSVESFSSLAGYSLLTESAGASYGMGIISLKSWKDRKESVDQLIKKFRRGAASINDAEIEFFSPPTVPGFGNASGFELRIINKTGNDDLQNFSSTINLFLDSLNKQPEIQSAYSSFNPNFPQYLIHIDKEIAAKNGVTPDLAMNTLQSLIGSFYTSNFIRFGMMYKVMIQSSPEFRAKPEDIMKMHVKNERGEMVPFSSFIRLERIYGPEQLTRYNMYTSALVNGNARAGFSSGDAISAINRTAALYLPKGVSIEWTGITREEILSGNQALYIFLLCLIFVYLLLSAQYESFLLPLAVILSLPAGVFGSFALLQALGLENNIYAQVALVMLIGLLGKNAILIVEFAIQKQKQGHSVLQAAIGGAASRFRPIIMTSLAFLAGLVPLCISSGPGALGNRSIGNAAAGGMLAGTIFGLILIPGLYVIFAGIEEGFKNKKSPVVHADEVNIPKLN